MIALDTNVLVRFLVEDDRSQAERARKLLAGIDARNDRCCITDIVLCELVWVLASCYGISRAEIGATIKKLIATRQLSFSSTDRVHRVVESFLSGAGDFADYLIREQAREAGCSAVATFDRKLLKEKGFSPL
jgi:predicted nucleic-acid-binding protein